MTRIETAISRALIDSGLVARLADYAHRAHPTTMLDEPAPHVAKSWAPDLLATPTGAALAALVEAAEDWLEAKVSTGHATVDLERAVIAWLAVTEETRDAQAEEHVVGTECVIKRIVGEHWCDTHGRWAA